MNVHRWNFVLAWALGAWAMTLLMSGGMAAVIFPTMKQLAPVLPEFVKTPQDHWSLAAGLVMRKIFFASDAVQLVLATISVVAMMVVLKGSEVARRLRLLMVISLTIACLTMLASAFWISPTMRREMDRAILASREGNAILMQEARSKFNSMHPQVTVLLEATLFAVLMTATTSAFALKREPGEGPI
jgi:hypothetical protein